MVTGRRRTTPRGLAGHNNKLLRHLHVSIVILGAASFCVLHLYLRGSVDQHQHQQRYTIKAGLMKDLGSKTDGWFLGPHQQKSSPFFTELVGAQWCSWKKGEHRRESGWIGSDKGNSNDLRLDGYGDGDGWFEAIFLLDGEIRVVQHQTTHRPPLAVADPTNKSLATEGDYIVAAAGFHNEYEVLQDSTAILVRWRRNSVPSKHYDYYGNVKDLWNDHNHWIMGSSFLKDTSDEPFYAENIEFKWHKVADVPWKKPAKAVGGIANYGWKTMGILWDGSFEYDFVPVVAGAVDREQMDHRWHRTRLDKRASYVYWYPNLAHECFSNEPFLLMSLRWRD